MGRLRLLGVARLLVVLLLGHHAPPASAGVRASGGSRSSFSSMPMLTPSAASVPFRPASSAFARPKTPATSMPFSSKPGGLSGFSNRRPGFRSTSLILPFAAGALAGTALYSLTNNQRSYCNGVSIQCYKATCESALRQCTSTNSTSLAIATCPDSRFSECWQSSDTLFQCFGQRRPSYKGQDLVSYCHTPESSMTDLTMTAGTTAPRPPVKLVLLLLVILLGMLIPQ